MIIQKKQFYSNLCWFHTLSWGGFSTIGSTFIAAGSESGFTSSSAVFSVDSGT